MPTDASSRGNRSFGPSCFALLAVFFVARIVFIFLPCDSWGPSAYLCAAPSLFLPNSEPLTWVAGAAYGEAARLANRLDFVTFRPEKFTVDRNGYRNLPSAAGTPPKLLLAGDSFALGMSLNDEETLSAQLTRQLGPIIYNAATTLAASLSPKRILDVSGFLRMKSGWVLLELVNRTAYTYEPPSSAHRFAFLGSYRDRFVRSTTPLRTLQSRVDLSLPLMRVSSLVNMRLHNDILLPNPFKDLYTEEELINGQHMLFYHEDRDFSRKSVDSSVSAVAVGKFRDALSRAGFKLAVVLVPTGYSVYTPLMRQPQGPDFGKQYMEDLAAQLAENGVPTMNCLPLLRDAASRELTAGRLVYWPDDAHWNPVGCATAARAVAPWLHSLTSGE
jgi:SGNH hydrolase-like domain, acetyltransferase AlgX